MTSDESSISEWHLTSKINSLRFFSDLHLLAINQYSSSLTKLRGSIEPYSTHLQKENADKRTTSLKSSIAHGETRKNISFQFSSLCRVRLCDPMNRSTPGLPVHHQLPEFTQTHVHRVGDAIHRLQGSDSISSQGGWREFLFFPFLFFHLMPMLC